MSNLKILHLVGSATDNFYAQLSIIYARDCLKATANPERYTFYIAHISADGQWRFPQSLEASDIAATEPMPLERAIAHIRQLQIDIVLPQMFCLPGMTTYRSLWELLNIPYIGNTSQLMALTADKGITKGIIAGAGIKVPPGELLQSGDIPTLAPPVIVKPTTADNSLGVSLVKEAAEYPTALATAFSYSNQVIVEKFIEVGREVRCGVIVQQGELIGLPLEEYLVEKDTHPIRNHQDKLLQNEQGELIFAAKGNRKSWIVDPKDPLTSQVQAIAKKCHRALGCRHYSLFDFRVDPQGQAWFIEAGLYCSFSPKSVISSMAAVAGISLDQLLAIMLENTLPERKKEVNLSASKII